jgi:hypothetical protein
MTFVVPGEALVSIRSEVLESLWMVTLTWIKDPTRLAVDKVHIVARAGSPARKITEDLQCCALGS